MEQVVRRVWQIELERNAHVDRSAAQHCDNMSTPSSGQRWAVWPRLRLLTPGLCLLLMISLSGCAQVWNLVDHDPPPNSELDPELTFSTFEARLTAAQTLDRDMQDLAQRLVEEWLARFTRPDVHRRFKLADYQVHEVRIREMQPDEWQVRATFSVQPVKSSLTQSAWLAGNGVCEQGWINHKVLFMHMCCEKSGDLVLTCGGTGP